MASRSVFVFVLLGLWMVSPPLLPAAQTWEEDLAQLPFQTGDNELASTNCAQVLLGAFHAGEKVKAMVFLPGAVDELYTFHRVKVPLSGETNLLQAIVSLTNHSMVRLTCRPPLLFLHGTADTTDAKITIDDDRTAERLKRSSLPDFSFNDRDWDAVQPTLSWGLKVEVKPWKNSPDSWHFYRQTLAGGGLNGWAAIQAFALSAKARATIKHKVVVFEPDSALSLKRR